MTSTSRIRRAATASAWVAAGALAATTITGLAFASGVPTATPSSSPAAVAAPGVTDGRADRGARILRHVLHGQLTLRTTTGTRTVDVQRGKVSAASPTSVTVVSTDGFTATYTISSSTTVRRDRRTVPAASIAVGDRVAVRGVGGTAVLVRIASTTGSGGA